MSEQTIPTTFDSGSSYLVRTTKDTNNKYVQHIQLCDDDPNLPVIINPATEDTLDDVKTLVTTSNSKIDTVNSNLGTLDTSIGDVETAVTGVDTTLSTTNTHLNDLVTALELPSTPKSAQVSVDNTVGGILLTASLAGKRSVSITNMDDITAGTNVLYIGPTPVTTTNGYPLRAGETIAFDLTGEIYGITDGAAIVIAGILELN